MQSRPISELEGIFRKNVIKAFVFLLLLFVAVALASALYEAELKAVAGAVYEALGLAGLFAILFVSDAIVSPIPPDLILVVLSQTAYDDYWVLLVLVIGMQSVLAGCTGWFLGSRLGGTRRSSRLLEPFRQRYQGLIVRHGRLAIAVAALTPLPFSLTCWAAGMLNMPFRRFLTPCWLRIPRFLVYYAAITYADKLGHWLVW
jgi:membrane protein YqaA with SNARE-associated domain